MQFSLDLDDGHETESAPMLYEYSMNTKTGQTGVRLMDQTLYGDFPVIPARFAGALHGFARLPVSTRGRQFAATRPVTCADLACVAHTQGRRSVIRT